METKTFEMAEPMVKNEDESVNVRIDSLVKDLATATADIRLLQTKEHELHVKNEELKKDMKSLVTVVSVAAVMFLITIAGLCYSIYETNNALVEHAEAINNNSYSIESIVESIRAE